MVLLVIEHKNLKTKKIRQRQGKENWEKKTDSGKESRLNSQQNIYRKTDE